MVSSSFVDVELADLAQAGAARAAALRVVEAEAVGIADEGFSHAREEQSQQRVYIGIGADRGTGVLRRLLLVDDDGDGQAFDGVDLRPPVFREILLDEGREGVVELAAALRRDGVHHQRTFAGARDARENGDPVFGNVERQVAEVILPRPADADGIKGLHGVSC